MNAIKTNILPGYSSLWNAMWKMITLILIVTISGSVRSETSTEVVLIAHESSKISRLSLLQVRRLYLGFNIDDKYVGRPVINRSDSKVYSNFLKNVMHMTQDGYKRKVVRRVFRYGSDYITELSTLDSIVEHLENNPKDIIFVKKENLSVINNAKIVMRLW